VLEFLITIQVKNVSFADTGMAVDKIVLRISFENAEVELLPRSGYM
jgi:hypothetical protein